MKDMLDRLVHLQETDERIVAFQIEEEKIPRELEEKGDRVSEVEGRLNQVRSEIEELDTRIKEFTREVEEAKDQQRRSQARALAVKTQR